MKALPPPPSQLELLPRRSDLVPFVVEPSVRHEVLRALAEILLAAAETVDRRGVRDEAP
jgi:hypothetical protein